MNLLTYLIIGLIAGWLAAQLVKGHGFGLVGDIVVGIIGALIGGYLFDLMGVTTYGFIGSVITSVVGAVILLAIIKMFRTAP
jgi:uncharacterized membrane protein YeaQ/YmgE (transglycosylase-associated protein family)